MKMKRRAHGRAKQQAPVVYRNNILDIEEAVAENITFAASLEARNIKTFVSVIRAMNFVDNTELQLSNSGLKYLVEESKSFQTIAYFKKQFFTKFNFRPPTSMAEDTISFGVNLSSFTELLLAFLDNNASSMNIVYFNDKNLISFVCTQTDAGESTTNKTRQQSTIQGDEEEDEPAGEIVTEYFVRTMQSVEPIDFNIDSPQLRNSLILDAYDFHGIINDFDRTTDGLEIKITNRRMQLKTVGILQCAAVAKFNADSEIFNKFECNEPSKFIYKFMYFKVMLKSLALSSKMALTTHVDGMLRIQLMVRSGEEESFAYIEYFMLPSLDEDSADE